MAMPWIIKSGPPSPFKVEGHSFGSGRTPPPMTESIVRLTTFQEWHDQHKIIVLPLCVPSSYKDHQYQGSTVELSKDLANSTTLYIGNLSFYTTEEQIYELFSKAGEIKRIIMGLDKFQRTPCGFCFVEYYSHKDALDCMKYINSTKLDERIIRTDLDPGYKDGRQFGRGRSGGQVRDEYRQDYDTGRGGWGHLRAKNEAERARRQKEEYEAITSIPMGAGEYKGKGTTSKKRERDSDDQGRENQDREKNPRFREDKSDDEEDEMQTDV